VAFIVALRVWNKIWRHTCSDTRLRSTTRGNYDS